MRRMWAGGAVNIRHGQKLGSKAGSVAPFRLKETVACVERIKDVRLQGTGDEAKIFVTIERRFAPRGVKDNESEGTLSADDSKQVVRDSDWSDSLVKEERSLVFMKAKTGSESMAVTSDQGATRYLKAPTNPDYSFTLTPTRSLLFRYSAITYNAHLIHLDPTYARYVEGHRNMLVHGPLTLTLMLQVLSKHLKMALSQTDQEAEAIVSIEYRNIAPLYCDEEMRVCVKMKKQTDAGHSYDVWIEGPTGGMAVKAVAHTAVQLADAVGSTSPKSVADLTSADLPDVQTVASQAQNTLRALDQEDPGTEQLSQVTREERRDRVSRVHSGEPDSSQTQTPQPYQGYVQFSRKWRSRWVGTSLRYLYVSANLQSPLLNNNEVERQSTTPPPRETEQDSHRVTLADADLVPYSHRWRKRWVGKSLPYLYLWGSGSALINSTVVPPNPTESSVKPDSTKPLKAPKSFKASRSVDLSPAQPTRPRTRGDRPPPPSKQPTPSPSGAPPPLKIRSIETDPPEGVFGFLNTASMQDEQDVKRLDAQRKTQRKTQSKPEAEQNLDRNTEHNAEQKREEHSKREPKIRKLEGVSIRKMDMNLKDTEKSRAHEKRAGGPKREAGGGGGAQEE
ncbi:hypothetical protein N0V86_005275 [Didymella sp. IMI 355093]|nr:hypothetical protein N0V86_005275 [Didymella sp. IMI 355093]